MSHDRTRLFIGLAAAALLFPAALLAQATAQAQDKQAPSAEEQALRKHAASYAEAFNSHEAKTVASLWSPDAVYISRSSGDEVVGREAIEKEMAAMFEKDAKSHLDITVNSVQFVSPNVAVVRGMVHVTRGDAPPEDSEFSAVNVKRDGQWLLDRVTEDDLPAAPAAHEELKKLAWLVGNWADDDPEADIKTEVQFTRNENFLTWAFAASIEDRVTMSGIQVIGYDAGKKQFRSWVFDSDGGFAEGLWTQKGNQWFIRQTGMLPDGRKSSALNIITKIDDNSFTWQSTNREIGGRIEPNVDEIRIVRQGGK